jgi:hypothetical protein
VIFALPEERLAADEIVMLLLALVTLAIEKRASGMWARMDNSISNGA